MDQLVPEYRLPAVLDAAAAPGLVTELVALRGGALALEAGEVTRLGGLCLQALLAAKVTWAADGKPFEIRNLSPELQETLALCGASSLGTQPNE
jgi:chemotaxis protein CheX